MGEEKEFEIKLVASTGNLVSPEDATRFAQSAGRICYSEKDWDELQEEKLSPGLTNHLRNCGHHSPFEHVHLTFYMKGIPKALAMLLNNERPYVTSEKSARYTVMKDIEPLQRELYDKWLARFIELVERKVPEVTDPKHRQKLAQENARYMTSVFTPTKMLHTLSLRKLNELIFELERVAPEYQESREPFKKRLAEAINGFLEQTRQWRVEGLNNRTERRLSFFRPHAKEYFGDVYSTFSAMSFACLAQAHRHRTIDYGISGGLESDATPVFFVPPIIQDTPLSAEWQQDLERIAESDIPQGQLLSVSETGALEDFRSKMILRLCGHAQYEIMRNTLATARKYAQQMPEVKEWARPKCQQGMKCNEPCVWRGEKALERII
jgi:thymidylate synthase ThyX